MGSGDEHFGRYRLVEPIGSGGMAVVFRAIVDGPRGFARSVVIKRILREHSDNASFVNMMCSEARISALLRHPNIVQVHEFGEIDGEFYLAMEWVEGADLLAILRTTMKREKRIPLGGVCYLISEVAAALGYAHALTDEQGRSLEIVHRDVSPSNIMLTTTGGVKLLDFGIAKATLRLEDEQTRTGTLKGKISYMSPEQADGLPIDRRSDIFSLGILFHECLTLNRFFKGESDLETLRRIRQAQPPAPSSMVSDLPPEIDAIVLKMLARAPEERYASCDEITAALKPMIHQLQGEAATMRRFLLDLGPLLLPSLKSRLAIQSSVAPTSVSVAGDSGSQPAPNMDPPTITRLSGELEPSRPSPTKRRRRVWQWTGLIAGVAGLALVFAGRFLPNTRSEAPKPTAGPPARTESLPAPLPARSTPNAVSVTPTVRLHVSTPRGAEVLVDGRLVGNVPVDVRLPRIDGERRLTVKSSGATPWSRTIAGDTDVSVAADPKRKRPSQSPRQRSPEKTIRDPFAVTPR